MNGGPTKKGLIELFTECVSDVLVVSVFANVVNAKDVVNCSVVLKRGVPYLSVLEQ
jgi:hypothetical protein